MGEVREGLLASHPGAAAEAGGAVSGHHSEVAVVDTVWSALLGVGGVVLVAEPMVSGSKCAASASTECLQQTSQTTAGIAALLVATPFAFSALYGYWKTAECRHLEEAQLSCTSGAEASCRTLQERKPH